MRPPDILVLLTDQHRAISAGCYGETDALTPNLDRFAEKGVLFENAYCQYPICVASRQSLLTGLYPGNNGTVQNYLHTIDPWQWTVAGCLGRAGYETALIGKAHCNTNGFHFVLESGEYARRYWPKDIFDKIHPPHFGLDYRRNAATAGVWPWEEKFLQSAFVEQAGLEFLRCHRERPFFTVLSFDFPHPPFLAPERHWRAFDPDALELPPVDPAQPIHPFWGKELLSEPMVRNYLHGYYACLAAVDECIGRILEAAESEGLLDNAVVIYTSDHGEAGGHHGKYEKHSFYDPEIRVPLIFRSPDLQPRRVSGLVELVDLAPTFLELAGVSYDGQKSLDGASICALLEGHFANWKNRAFIENYRPEKIERDGTHKAEEHGRALVRDGFKCCLGGNMPDAFSLFDLRADPEELVNLWEFPGHLARRDSMVSQIIAGWAKLDNPEQSRAARLLVK